MCEACNLPDTSEGTAEAGAPNGQHTRYRVSGMDCASCATKIDNALRRVLRIMWTSRLWFAWSAGFGPNRRSAAQPAFHLECGDLSPLSQAGCGNGKSGDKSPHSKFGDCSTGRCRRESEGSEVPCHERS